MAHGHQQPQRSRTLATWGLAAAATLAAWWVFAAVLVPVLIRLAYNGKSFPWLNTIIDGQGAHGVQYYIGLWMVVLWPGLGILAAIWVTAFLLSRPMFFQWFVGPATPGTLGAIRALTAGLLCLSAAWEDFAHLAVLPDEVRRSMGVATLFYAIPGFEAFLRNPLALSVFQGVTVALLALATLGWRSRLTVPLGGLAFFVMAGTLRLHSFFWHQHLVPLYLMVVLALTPCGDGFSVDRLRRIARGQPVPDPDQATARYGWARYACWAVIACAYTAAGFSKLRNAGWLWWSGNNMRRILFTDTLNTMQFDWQVSLSLVDAPDAVFAFLGASGVFGEALYVLVLVWPLARLILPAAMGAMHVGIVFLQNILFIDLIALQAVFYDWRALRLWAGKRLAAARGFLTVLYDGDCGLCRRTIRLLGAWDLLRRLAFVDFRHGDQALVARTGVARAVLEQEMAVVDGAKTFLGFAAYRRLAAALPAFWPLVPLLWVPGVGAVGQRIYQAVAGRRGAMLTCGAHCAVPRTEAPVQAPSRPAGLAPAFGVAAFLVLFSANWISHLEFFPLTGLQMYTGARWRGTSPITYYRAAAIRADGRAPKAVFDRAMGVMALNARYRPILVKCFGAPSHVRTCEKFFAACGEAYNRRVSPGERLVAFEIEKRHWNYHNHPHDPEHGRQLGLVVVPLPPSAGQDAAAPR